MLRRLETALVLGVFLLLSTVPCPGAARQRKDKDVSGQVSVSGAFALFPLAVEWKGAFEAGHPGVRIDVSAGGAGKGMTDILNGMTDFAMLSRELHEEEKQRGAIAFTVGRDAVIPVISAANPFREELLRRGITADDARKIWITREIRTWGELLGSQDRTPIHPYTRSDACGAAQTFAAWFDGKQDQLGGTAVFGDPGIASAVKDDRLGIGFNNLAYAFDAATHVIQDGLLAFPIDLDGNGSLAPDEYFYDTKEALTAAIEQDRFPSPPARKLYLVSKGVPTEPAAKAFLRYILREGQDLNEPNGYVRITDDIAREGLFILRHPGKASARRRDRTGTIIGIVLGLAALLLLIPLGERRKKNLAGKRIYRQRISEGIMFALTAASLLVLIGILVLLVVKSLPILQQQSLLDVLTGTEWMPSQGKFGFAPFIGGTILVTLGALVLAVPVSLFTAIFLAEYARSSVRRLYGVWGVLFLVPKWGYSLQSGSLVLAVMILPLLISLLVEIFSSISKELREASLALGATTWQTTRKVVLRKSIPGIFASVVLALSKCVGETIAVMMLCGSVASIPGKLSDGFYTLPALIGNNYGEMASIPLYESAIMFAALLLAVIVLLFNVLSRIILYRIQKNMA